MEQPIARVFLSVPFAERGAAREAGARFDGDAKRWYVPEGKDPAAKTPEVEKPLSDTEQACERATTNLALYNSGDKLQRDKDGDGKPEPLTPKEIASEKNLAERQAAAYCPKSDA